MEKTTAPLSCPPVSTLLPPTDAILENLEPVSEKEVMKIIKGSSKASCSLDPVPTRMLVDHLLPELLPVITDIIDASLTSGVFPEILRMALVKPLLKKISLSPEIFKNYRPISNLPFLSKVIERVVASRLTTYLARNGLLDKMQSAYKAQHSTETALLRVHNDILNAVDKKSGVFLALIDLSAAFDTVDHTILLNFLKDTLGIRGRALRWFKTYLTERLQCVSINDVLSELTEILFGVPQGSVMGPLKFCVYTLPIGAIIRAHGLHYAIYADDTQIYLSFDINEPNGALDKLNACLNDIRSWMIAQKLKINDDKTEFVIFGSPYMHQNLDKTELNLSVGTCNIDPSKSAKNLGVIFDQNLNMDQQITKTCQAANFHLRNIGSIRHYLTDTAAAQLVHSLISSRLDYCNSLLTGIPDYQLDRLQRILNNAARIVCRLRKSDHISQSLKDLHWLPVQQRIKFKISLLTYKCLHGKAPEYLSDLLQAYSPPRVLRSSNQKLLSVPRFNLNTYGGRAFSYIAPTEWNDLPCDVRNCDNIDSFKTKLKTYLFRSAY